MLLNYKLLTNLQICLAFVDFQYITVKKTGFYFQIIMFLPWKYNHWQVSSSQACRTSEPCSPFERHFNLDLVSTVPFSHFRPDLLSNAEVFCVHCNYKNVNFSLSLFEIRGQNVNNIHHFNSLLNTDLTNMSFSVCLISRSGDIAL